MKKQVFYYVSNNGAIWRVELLPALALAFAITKGIELYNDKREINTI